MKKALSLLLAVLMVFTLLPVSALADGETPGTAESTAEAGMTPMPDEALVSEETQGPENTPALEETPAPETTEEPTSTPEPARVTVRFNCTPEDAEITVYEKAVFELAKTDGTEAEKIVAEEDGSYRLIPGCYIYMATCDGYFPAEEVEFAVDPDCDEMYVDIELELTVVEEASEEAIPVILAASSDEQYAWFPAYTMNLSQLAYESYSHGDQNAIDMLPNGNVFAPFTGKVAYVDANWGYVVLQSINKVHWADGSYDYMTVGFMHDSDISDIYVGRIISQGEEFYQAGGMGDGNPNAYGAHVHITVHRGHVTRGYPYGTGD